MGCEKIYFFDSDVFFTYFHHLFLPLSRSNCVRVLVQFTEKFNLTPLTSSFSKSDNSTTSIGTFTEKVTQLIVTRFTVIQLQITSTIH